MPFGPTRKTAGERDQRVDLQTSIMVRDAMGGRTQVWSTYAEGVFAAVDLTPFVVSETQATVQYVVTIPYEPLAAVDQRVLVKTLTLKIIAVMNPELEDRSSVLYCAIAAEVN